jgi:hypothetical protein
MGIKLCHKVSGNDETSPNSIERKHPRKGEKMKQGSRIEVQANKQPNTSEPQGGKGTTNNQTLHQLHEANQLKRGDVNLMKLLA